MTNWKEIENELIEIIKYRTDISLAEEMEMEDLIKQIIEKMKGRYKC